MYCEYSTGSGIDRKNQRMCEVERVADWILILFRWLVAMPNRTARILETGWNMAADTATARSGWRRFERGSLVRKGPRFRSIGWMTYCLGRGWSSAPPGLSPALVSPTCSRDVPRFMVWAHRISSITTTSCHARRVCRASKPRLSGHCVTRPTSRCPLTPPIASRRSVRCAGAGRHAASSGYDFRCRCLPSAPGSCEVT